MNLSILCINQWIHQWLPSHRGRGPLKSTMDVINAAKKISEHGSGLDKLAKTIADQVMRVST